MSKVEELVQAIKQLSWEERAELNRLLYGWEDDDWDRQMEADAAGGKLDKLIDRLKEDEKSGRLMDFPF